MRIKLSLKLPTQANRPTTTTTSSFLPLRRNNDHEEEEEEDEDNAAPTPGDNNNEDDDNEEEDDDDDDDNVTEAVKVTVVDSDDEESTEEEVVAQVLEEESNTPSSGWTGKTGRTTPAAAPSTSASGGPWPKAGASTTSAAAGPGKRRSLQPTASSSKSVKLPPISSPGLLLVLPSSAGPKGGSAAPPIRSASPPNLPTNAQGYVTPAALFQNAMQAAGYTLEERTQHPHRGSSVQRVVGDLFDSQLKLSLHFPELVPTAWLTAPSVVVEDEDDHEPGPGSSSATMTLPEQLIQCLAPPSSAREPPPPPPQRPSTAEEPGEAGPRQAPAGRKRPAASLEWADMIPVSLTIPYPEWFLEKRVKYVQQVQAREKAIVAWQEAEEEAVLVQEQLQQQQMLLSLPTTSTNSGEPPSVNPSGAGADSGARPDLVTSSGDPPAVAAVEALKAVQQAKNRITPIPTPPEPPTLAELVGFCHQDYDDTHPPIYLPRHNPEFVAHLDPEAFHITEGRYFGLLSNFVADPNFVGANAPGIAGVSASGGAGLATAMSGSSASGGLTALALSSSSYPASLRGTGGGGGTSILLPGKDADDEGRTTQRAVLSRGSSSTMGGGGYVDPKVVTSTPPVAASSSAKSLLGPKPTASALDLKKLMEEDTQVAQALKQCIIKAAVHASRSGRHGQSFLATNGEAYPDVSKAFAAHAGIKPCQRCKSNKQGAYHCRLRRRHKDPDYDGGDSHQQLSPLFTVPMETLLCPPPSTTVNTH